MDKEKKAPGRAEALALFREFNDDPGLLDHALAVEAVMRHLARTHGEDEEMWGVVGLVHDLDYERYPDEHCTRTGAILAGRGWPEPYIRAAVSHGWGICSDVEPRTLLEKYLYAADELTGLVKACALVRPSRSVADLTVRSVRKKWKDRRFAAGVDRAVIERGAQRLGVPLDELISVVIEGLRELEEGAGKTGPRAA